MWCSHIVTVIFELFIYSFKFHFIYFGNIYAVLYVTKVYEMTKNMVIYKLKSNIQIFNRLFKKNINENMYWGMYRY